MDIARSEKVRSRGRWFASRKMLLLSAAVVVVIIGFALRSQSSSAAIKRDALVIGVVKSGRFDVSVDGYGELKSGSARLITSDSKATVEELVLKPGAKVTPDSVILRMSNPQIDQDLDLARHQLEAEKIAVQEIGLTQQRELQEAEAALFKVQSELELAQMREKAMADLAKARIISSIAYAEISLNAKQLRHSLQIEKQRYATLQKINGAQIEIRNRLVQERQLAYDKVMEQKNRLTVRAGKEGTLQLLYVELGQSIDTGKELALIGGDRDLDALVKIPQSRSDAVQIGQPATISVGGTRVPAKVAQINPGVADGSVLIELKPDQPLPVNARPGLNVDASVGVGSFPNALYVERPANVVANASSSVFVVDGSADVARRTKVEFGQESGKLIQIRNGVPKGSSIVLSDVSKYASEDVLAIAD